MDARAPAPDSQAALATESTQAQPAAGSLATESTESTEPVVSPGSADSAAGRRIGGGRLRAYVELIRPGNALMAAAGGATGLVLAGDPTRTGLLLAATLPPLLIAGFGNVVNDLRDVHLDRVAHPARALPSGRVRRAEAWTLAGLLLVTGLAWTEGGGFAAFALAGLNALLLGLYEVRLKAAGLAGNILVALLVGSTFVYGGVVATGGVPTEAMLWLLAGMAAATNLARELLKDVEDLDADRGHRNTFPLRFGPGPARLVAFACVNLAVIASLLAFLRSPGDWWWAWLAFLGLADALFLVGACWAWLEVGRAQRLLKLAMLVALVAFLLGPSVGAQGVA